MPTGGRGGYRRIGKSDAALLATIMDSGEVSRGEIAGALGKSPNAVSQQLKRLVDVGLVEMVGRGLYRVCDELQRRVEDLRELGGEPEADRLQLADYERQRKAYRTYLEKKRRGERTHDDAPSYVAEEMPSQQPHCMGELKRMPEVRQDLVEALGHYLWQHPSRRTEKPSWFAVALWSGEHIPYKPTPEDIEVALYELGKRVSVA